MTLFHPFATLPMLVQAVLGGLALFGIVGAAPAAGAAPADSGGAPAGGGAAPAAPAAEPGDAAPADGDASAPDDAADGLEAGAAGDDEPTDDEVEQLEELLPHLNEEQLRARLKREHTARRHAQRRAQKYRPIVDRFKRPGTNEYMSAQEIEAVLAGHREFSQLDTILRASPRAVQVLMEEEQRLRSGGQPPADQPEPFNETDWPFETETPQGKALLSMAKQNHEMSHQLKQLSSRVGGVDQRFEQQTVAQLEGQWKQATYTAASELDEAYRPMFVSAVGQRFQMLRQTGQLTKANAKAVIDQMLGGVRAAKKKQQRTTVTRQSEIVAGNTTLPKTPRPGTVQPASGEKPRGRHETIKDAKTSFFKRYVTG